MMIYFKIFFHLSLLISALAEHCSTSQCSVVDYQDEVDWSEHINDLWAWMSAQKSKNVVTFCNSDKATFSPTDFTHSPIKGKFLFLYRVTNNESTFSRSFSVWI